MVQRQIDTARTRIQVDTGATGYNGKPVQRQDGATQLGTTTIHYYHTSVQRQLSTTAT